MDIIHIGHSSFKITSKNGKVVTDPFDPEVTGLKFPKTEADIVTISHQHQDHNAAGQIEGGPLVISGPGEYEIKGIKIMGVGTFHDNVNGGERGKNTVYRIDVDSISVVHLGDLGHKLSDHEIDILDGVDILMIPVGGYFTIDPHTASEIISQLDPKIIIPMHYNSILLKPENFSRLSTLDAFLKEMGKESITPLPKLNISKDKLPVEPTIIVLE